VHRFHGKKPTKTKQGGRDRILLTLPKTRREGKPRKTLSTKKRKLKKGKWKKPSGQKSADGMRGGCLPIVSTSAKKQAKKISKTIEETGKSACHKKGKNIHPGFAAALHQDRGRHPPPHSSFLGEGRDKGGKERSQIARRKGFNLRSIEKKTNRGQLMKKGCKNSRKKGGNGRQVFRQTIGYFYKDG